MQFKDFDFSLFNFCFFFYFINKFVCFFYFDLIFESYSLRIESGEITC